MSLRSYKEDVNDVLGMQELFLLVILVEEMLRIRIRTQDNLRSLDVPLGGPDLPLPIRSLFDARDGSVGVQMTVGMRGFEGFAHETGAEAVSEQ